MNSPLTSYTRAAECACVQIIRAYSTSFNLATRMLGRRHRQHICNIYALVRVADEIVDGVAHEAGLPHHDQVAVLDDYIARVHRAMETGYSSDMVIHAFAQTARASGITTDLTTPFFTSMHTDLRRESEGVTHFDSDAHQDYVYGSAEVVGLMCLHVFIRGHNYTQAQRTRLERGARQLGAAFQNINFLRDLADDTSRLGRHYLSADGHLTEAGRKKWVAVVRQQLADASEVIPLLPVDARAGVRSALHLFGALTKKVEKTPVATLNSERVRVPDPVKIGIAGRALLSTWMESRS